METILKEAAAVSGNEPISCKSTSEKKFERLQNKANPGVMNAIYASQDNIQVNLDSSIDGHTADGERSGL